MIMTSVSNLTGSVVRSIFRARRASSCRAGPRRSPRAPGPQPVRLRTVTTTVVPEYADVVSRYEPVIGLEVHVELGTRTKMFCGCPTTFGAEPNTQVCPVCLGLPGSLPVANRAAIEATIRIGLALHCEIASWCRF